ncbi:MAG: hypothetical protein LBK25_00305, partial [Treponema sp.]|nr:hypothetical protein [Treponema sp.]
VIDAKINEDVLNEKGTQDLSKMKPVSFIAFQYFGLGNNLGKAFSLGKEFRPNNEVKYFDLDDKP